MTELRGLHETLAEFEEIAQHERMMERNPEIRIYINLLKHLIRLEKRIDFLEDVARITHE